MTLKLKILNLFNIHSKIRCINQSPNLDYKSKINLHNIAEERNLDYKSKINLQYIMKNKKISRKQIKYFLNTEMNKIRVVINLKIINNFLSKPNQINNNPNKIIINNHNKLNKINISSQFISKIIIKNLIKGNLTRQK